MLDDGAETDLDLGHYERFTNVKLTRLNNLNATTGSMLSNRSQQRTARANISGQDRAGDSARHRRNQRPHSRPRQQDNADVVITEVGGTTGDIEGLPFEQFANTARMPDVSNVCYIHDTLSGSRYIR